MGGTFWNGEEMEHDESMTQSERDLLDRFVQEYLIDFNATTACIRLGYTKSFAEGYAVQFMDKPYVRKKIVEAQQAESPDEKKEKEATRRRIRSMLMREAQYRGPGSSHAARVGALTKLMSMYDMDSPTKHAHDHKVRGGVMMAPGIATVEDWEAEAQASQTNLQEASKV